MTGAAGFIGSHLMQRHLAAGDQVVGIDNFCSSSPGSQHVTKIKEACDEAKGCALFAGDITSKSALNSAARKFEGKIDLIYNFACPASPPRYQSMPIATMMTCTVGTANVLELARERYSVVIHASTSEIYGNPTVSPQEETYRGCVNPYGPRACYDEGKRAAEALCFDYFNSRGVDARLVRIFNTYGPNMDPDDGRVVSNFICQALRGKKLTVYGHGNQTRSFCYIDDLVNGIVAMGELSRNPGTPVNLGNPHEFTINELVEKVEMITGTSLGIDRREMPIDDPSQRRPDITLARALLGWQPRAALDDGLKFTVKYFRDVLGAV